jgi:hypothetical protein
MASHRIRLFPGQTVEIVLVETLDNGYEDEVGLVTAHWQDRDAPVGEIASKHRELQIRLMASGGRVGPIVVTHS